MSAGLRDLDGQQVVRAAARAGRADRRFFSGMAVAALITVYAGFAPTYYLRGYSLVPGA